MKKFLAVLCTLALTAGVFAGCAGEAQEPTKQETNTAAVGDTGAAESTESVETTELASGDVADPVEMNVVALKGPTAMGMVSFMNQVDSGEITDNQYQFSIVAAVDEVTPMIVKGEADIAAVPANLASVLYNNTEGGVQVLAVNTLGVLYIVGTGEEFAGAEDLRGKTIYASGKGATPEYALNYILSANGIDPAADVTIEWKSEHTECLSAVLADENAVAMLPQPFVTTAQAKSEQLNVLMDLTAEWDKLQENSENPSALLTGVVVVRKEFAEANPAAVEAFMAHYAESVDFVNNNVDEAAELVGNYEIVTAEVAKKAIPACNITCIAGEEMQEKLSGYLEVLYEQNPKAVGGALPADDFYYN